jgi:glycosyltransferase involved in cell wall biosynthesis
VLQGERHDALMHKKTKILIVTDSPVLPTGLAETTRLIFGGLLERHPDEYELHQIGLFQCYAVTTPKWPVYPTRTFKDRHGKLNFAPDDKHAEKTFLKLLPKNQPDIVFVFGDPQNVLHFCLPKEQRRYRLILYVTFDGLPLMQELGPALSRADQILTMSEFSMDVLRRCSKTAWQGKLDYLYCPADTARFTPASEPLKAEMRRDLLPPWMPQDAFLLGWVGRNQWRKQVWVQYKVLHYLRTGKYLVCHDCGKVSLFDWDPSRQTHLDELRLTLESRPDYKYDVCAHCRSHSIEPAKPLSDVFLWCHMAEDPKDEWPARWLERQFGVERGRDLWYTPGHQAKAGLSPDDMPMLYKLWDCFLYLSGGEGFGVPAWEAMCSGLPSVYTNYSAHGELLTRAGAGIPVGGVLQPERESCVWRILADMPQTIEAVRRLYYDRDLRTALSANGRKFVDQFATESQVEKWHRIFQQVANG